MVEELKNDLKKLAEPKKISELMRFFKTGKGEYGEGDTFLGVRVPDQRTVSKKYKDLPLLDIQKLLDSNVHEYRLTALFILVLQYKKVDEEKKAEIFKFYLKNAKNINNWDLVDSSAPNIVGDYLLTQDRGILYKLAKSQNLWKKRISMLATYTFIKNDDFEDVLKIAEILINDNHDLIHKAVGWMLRELGNRDQKKEEEFLKKYYKMMPRTMLRYAIEKFSDEKRKFYLNK